MSELEKVLLSKLKHLLEEYKNGYECAIDWDLVEDYDTFIRDTLTNNFNKDLVETIKGNE